MAESVQESAGPITDAEARAAAIRRVCENAGVSLAQSEAEVGLVASGATERHETRPRPVNNKVKTWRVTAQPGKKPCHCHCCKVAFKPNEPRLSAVRVEREKNERERSQRIVGYISLVPTPSSQKQRTSSASTSYPRRRRLNFTTKFSWSKSTSASPQRPKGRDAGK